jgi:hypothetical protein
VSEQPNIYKATDDIDELDDLVNALSTACTIVAEYCRKWNAPEPAWLGDVGNAAREAEARLLLWEEQIRAAEDEHDNEQDEQWREENL